MLGGLRGASRTSLLLVVLAVLLFVTGIASASLIAEYGLSGGFSPALLLVGAGPMSIFAVLLVVLALSRPEGVEEVFLVHDSGLLLVHFSKTVRPEKDRDIVVGMLTAVQGFIRDVFAKGTESGLRMLDFGDRRILIFKGSHSYLALVVRGRVPLGLTGRMRRTLVSLEERYQVAINRWNGNADSLAGADDVLLEGLLGDELRQIAAQLRAVLLRVVRLVTPRRAKARIPSGRTTRADPRVSARELMDRVELELFKDDYREMMRTMLQEIRDGRLTLAGFGNLYVTMAMQKTPRSGAVGWWELMLRTVREVLRTWPWDAESQAWVMPADPPVPVEVPTSAPAPVPFPAPFPAMRPAEAGGAVKAPAVAELRSDSG